MTTFAGFWVLATFGLLVAFAGFWWLLACGGFWLLTAFWLSAAFDFLAENEDFDSQVPPF